MNGQTCTKCGDAVSLTYHQYCVFCLRISKGRNPHPARTRDASNKTMCCRCKANPRLPYHNYCQACKNKSVVEWAARKRGWWNSKSPEQKKKSTVRAYINHKVHRGQLDRKPCEICGKPSEHHHLDYEDRTLNVRHLCRKHHRSEEKKLTTPPA